MSSGSFRSSEDEEEAGITEQFGVRHRRECVGPGPTMQATTQARRRS